MSSDIEQIKVLVINKAYQIVCKLLKQRPDMNPPFLPQEYFSFFNINDMVIKDLGEASAVLLTLQTGKTIYVNQKHSLARQHFSCAHELGHLIFNELGLQPNITNIEFRETNNLQNTNIGYTNIKEHLCDTAAAELLMPSNIFKHYLKRLGISIESIPTLSDIFKVSNYAAAIRVEEVSPEPCIALLWNVCIKRNHTTLVLSPRRGKVTYLPTCENAKPTSPLFKAFDTNETINSIQTFRLNGGLAKRCKMESKGFNNGKNRYVISMVFPER